MPDLTVINLESSTLIGQLQYTDIKPMTCLINCEQNSLCQLVEVVHSNQTCLFYTQNYEMCLNSSTESDVYSKQIDE